MHELDLFLMQALKNPTLNKCQYTPLLKTYPPPPPFSDLKNLLYMAARLSHRQHLDLDRPQYFPGQGHGPGGGPSKSNILAVVTVFPVGGFLLLLSGMTLAGTLIGLALTFPLFVIFSPVLVPASLTVALALAGFLTSAAFGITALCSLSWVINYLRKGRGPDLMEEAKQHAGYGGVHGPED